MAFGGLGVMMFSTHSPLWTLNGALSKVDLQSFFFASMFMIILVVLAYLTNPSETSFRNYLTEQTFRQHLRRLDDEIQDDPSDRENSGVHYTLSQRSTGSSFHKPRRSYDSNPPFHFVNRASVSLRTPKHVFHSFGILTVAAILPTGVRSRNHNVNGSRMVSSGSLLSDSWFIGAFGKWWRGGTIQSWWLETMANAKDAERCNSGVLDVKTLDSLEGYDGLPFNVTSSAIPDLSVSNKLRDSVRPTQRTHNVSARSLTPPPLPKSASLPLHAPRLPTASPPSSKGSKCPLQRQALCVPQPSISATVVNGQPPANISHFDQSPVISEILRQISVSESAVYDLRNQLNEFRSAAADSHSLIQCDLDAHRERKRQEDAAKLELKTRTKALDDSKRTAESSKREAEKKLKAAESARDHASERVGRLDKEIGELKGKMEEDERLIVKSQEEGSKVEAEMVEELEHKKKEIKVAEDVVAALNARAKELEEKIAAEEERLKLAKEQAELRKQDRDFFPLHVVNTEDSASSDVTNPWSPIMANEVPAQDPHLIIQSERAERIEVFSSQTLHVPRTRSRGGSGSSGSRETSDFSVSPRPRKLSLGIVSNFHEQNGSIGADSIGPISKEQVAVRPVNGFIPFEHNHGVQTHAPRFSPFGDQDGEIPPDVMHEIGAPSPKSTSLIPTSLIQSLESAEGIEDLSRSFQSETDDFLDRDWRKKHPFPLQPVESPNTFSSSPTSVSHPSFDEVDNEDIFKVRPPPPLRHRLTSDSDIQHTFNPTRSSSDPPSLTRSRTRESDEDQNIWGHRRWFSSPKESKEKKGLNPEAKAFQLGKSFALPSVFHSSPSSANSHDSTNPSNMNDSISSNHASIFGTLSNGPSALPAVQPSLSAPNLLPLPVSSSANFSRAFAPSPAEREVLTRAMGSSTNTSLERLPTLSEVSIASIPSSPSHVHVIHAHVNPHSHSNNISISSASTHSSSEVGNRIGLFPPGLAWLQSLPRMRKPKFSPWEDDLVVPGVASEEVGSLVVGDVNGGGVDGRSL
ncbi:hypothetical protein C8Q75DRAFT_734665 [Abortiporus biennis]|nr:hypothetical protein C8Q75DRAFT_734665 [Abortiporus biennis]